MREWRPEFALAHERGATFGLTTEVHRTWLSFRPAAGHHAAADGGDAPDGVARCAVWGVVTAQIDEPQDPILLDAPLLTADDVAALLAVPRSSVYEYARRLHDPLPSLRIGRHRRFDRRSVERWLAAQRSS